MKQVSDELREYLHTRTEFFICDLYEITLAGATNLVPKKH